MRRRLAPFSMDDPRAERARELRRQGRTVKQIVAELEPVTKESVTAWCRDVPSPHDRWRYAAKDELRERCRELRGQGMTYDEIAAATGASRGSLSLWLRDLQVRRGRRMDPDVQRKKMRDYWDPLLEEREIERQRAKAAARTEVGRLTDRELMLVGAVLYWAEGGKDKPYRRQELVRLSNSDPDIIRVFLAWLELVRVPRDRIRFRVYVHETADVAEAERFWAGVVDVPVTDLQRTVLKRHNPRTNRLNRDNSSYQGCLMIQLLGGASLYQRIHGLWQGIARVAEATEDRN